MIHIYDHSLIFSVLTLVSRCFRWSFRDGPTTTLNCTSAFNPLSNTSSSEWTCGALMNQGSRDRKGKRGKGKEGWVRRKGKPVEKKSKT